MNVEDLLRTAVDDAVREVPPGFADGAMRRAARARRRARVGAGGAVLVMAAAAGVALAGSPGPRADAPPAGGGDVDVIDLGSLPAGAPPEIPWYTDGALHLGAASTPYENPGHPATPPIIGRVGGGYVVTQIEPDQNHATVTLVRDDGRQAELTSGLVSSPSVSPDGELLAWSVQNQEPIPDTDQTITTRVTVAGADGAVLAELPESASPHASPAGYLGDGRLLLNAWAGGEPGVYAWDVGADEITPLRRDADLLTASPATGLGVLGGGSKKVTDLTTGEDLWTFEDGKNPSFSPDGRYLAGSDWPDTLDPPSILVLRDARTGDERLRAAFEWIADREWESPTTIVLSVVQDGRAALVRCTVAGACELAAEPRPAGADPLLPDTPYVLGHR